MRESSAVAIIATASLIARGIKVGLCMDVSLSTESTDRNSLRSSRHDQRRPRHGHGAAAVALSFSNGLSFEKVLWPPCLTDDFFGSRPHPTELHPIVSAASHPSSCLFFESLTEVDACRLPGARFESYCQTNLVEAKGKTFPGKKSNRILRERNILGG
ncbi:MAG: hypothetical protein SF339_18550 [Blastocatellia bacterium]|nr:hypothetical protein [Blastocatellia bacterium]